MSKSAVLVPPQSGEMFIAAGHSSILSFRSEQKSDILLTSKAIKIGAPLL